MVLKLHHQKIIKMKTILNSISHIFRKSLPIFFFVFSSMNSYSQRELYGFKQLNDSIKIDPIGSYIKVFTYSVYTNDSSRYNIYYDSIDNKIYMGEFRNGMKNGLWVEYIPSSDYLKDKQVTSHLKKEDEKNLSFAMAYYFISDTVLFSIQQGENNKYSYHEDGSAIQFGTWESGMKLISFKYIGTQYFFDNRRRIRTIIYSFNIENRNKNIEVTIALDKKGKVISVTDKNP